MPLKTTLKALAAYEGGESRDCECWPGSPSIQRSSCITADSATTWIGQTESSFLSSSNEIPAGPNGKAIDLIKAAAFEAQMGLFAGGAVIKTLTLKIKITMRVICSSRSTRGGVWGSGFGLASQGALSFLPFAPQLCHCLRFNMSGARVFSGAHHIVLRDCTVNAANTVREKAIRYS